MTDIEFLAAASYAAGKDPIAYATESAAQVIAMRDKVIDSRRANPGTYPAWPDATPEYVANRIVGMLLDAGWKPPAEDVVAAAVAHTEERSEWFAAHQHLPCRCSHRMLTHLGAPGQKCTECDDCWSWQPDLGEAQ